MTESTFKKYCLVVDEWFVNGFNNTKKFISPRHNNYYVYLLINPIDKKPFYIGKGKKNRAKTHVREVINNQIINHKKHLVIKQILKHSLEPIICIVENNLTEEIALDLEGYLINIYKSKITNIQSGRLSKNDKTAIWAKIELSKMKTFCSIIKENRKLEEVKMYLKHINILNKLSTKELLWH